MRSPKACAGLPTDMFFDDDPTEALAVCHRCPVAVECLWATLDVEEGVTGATTPATRSAIRARMIAAGNWAPIVDEFAGLDDGIAHGTDRGHTQHHRRGEPSCDDCRRAHADYERNRRPSRAKVAA